MKTIPRWTLRLRRSVPNDNDWPWRWHIEIYDNEYWHPNHGSQMRHHNITFTEAGAKRWARRFIAKIERSEASRKKIEIT